MYTATFLKIDPVTATSTYVAAGTGVTEDEARENAKEALCDLGQDPTELFLEIEGPIEVF